MATEAEPVEEVSLEELSEFIAQLLGLEVKPTEKKESNA